MLIKKEKKGTLTTQVKVVYRATAAYVRQLKLGKKKQIPTKLFGYNCQFINCLELI